MVGSDRNVRARGRTRASWARPPCWGAVRAWARSAQRTLICPLAERPAAVKRESVRTGRGPPRSGRLDGRADDPLAVTACALGLLVVALRPTASLRAAARSRAASPSTLQAPRLRLGLPRR